MSRKQPYVQKFRKDWLNNPDLKDWLQEHSDNILATCKFCKGSINARFSDLIAHSHNKKHTKATEPFSSKRQKKLPYEFISQDCKLRCANI